MFYHCATLSRCLVTHTILAVRAFAMGAGRTVETTQLARLVWRLAQTAEGNQKWRIFIFDFVLSAFLSLFLLISSKQFFYLRYGPV